MLKRIIDVTTGEVTEKELNSKELEHLSKLNSQAEAEAKALAEKEAARQSALEKLAALGLTEAEIAALAG